MSAEFSRDTLAEVRLASVRGVGPLIRGRLIDRFGDANNVLCASTQELTSTQGVGPRLASSIHEAPDVETALQQLQEAASRGIFATRIEQAEYPQRLREIYDPPAVLYHRGDLLPADLNAVAVVGTRRASRYGLRQAEAIAEGLARAGVTVVSGLARGIDAAAHRAAIRAGGRTLAVMAGGLMRIYPPEHDRLADEVAAHGALISEAPPHVPPMSGSFPQRNRIISGLSLGVVVIEAAERSGALITARHAAEQGREAFAIPGPVDSNASRGAHRLIQEGAKLVMGVEDVLEEFEDQLAQERMGPIPTGTPVADQKDLEIASPTLNEDEAALIRCIESQPTTIDIVAESAGAPVERVLVLLNSLETKGLVRRVSGSLVCRA